MDSIALVVSPAQTSPQGPHTALGLPGLLSVTYFSLDSSSSVKICVTNHNMCNKALKHVLLP